MKVLDTQEKSNAINNSINELADALKIIARFPDSDTKTLVDNILMELEKLEREDDLLMNI